MTVVNKKIHIYIYTIYLKLNNNNVRLLNISEKN
jgi:hypothetical protein